MSAKRTAKPVYQKFNSKRLNAGDTCKERNYKVGDILCSNKWKENAKIRHISPMCVNVGCLRDDGTMFHEKDLRTFPVDVQIVEQ